LVLIQFGFDESVWMVGFDFVYEFMISGFLIWFWIGDYDDLVLGF
jgi:hypothetical protein